MTSMELMLLIELAKAEGFITAKVGVEQAFVIGIRDTLGVAHDAFNDELISKGETS